MSFIRYVTAQGTIDSSPGLVKILPKRRSRRSKYPVLLYGSALDAFWHYRKQIQAFVFDLEPVYYERFVLQPANGNGDGDKQQSLCFQHLFDQQIAFGYAADPEKSGWGLRNRVILWPGIILINLFQAVGHAVILDGDEPQGPNYEWALKGTDAVGREFRISERHLMINVDQEGSSALMLERHRYSLWSEIIDVAIEVLSEKTGTLVQDFRVAQNTTVNAQKMGPGLVRMEVMEEGAQAETYRLDELMIEVLSLIPQRYWGPPEESGEYLYLLGDDEEDE